MRFLCFYKSSKPEGVPPTVEEMTTMGKLVEDSFKSGILLAADGTEHRADRCEARVEIGQRRRQRGERVVEVLGVVLERDERRAAGADQLPEARLVRPEIGGQDRGVVDQLADERRAGGELLRDAASELDERDRGDERVAQRRSPVGESVAEVAQQRPERGAGVHVERVEHVVEVDRGVDLVDPERVRGAREPRRRRPRVDDVDVHVLERGVRAHDRGGVAVDVAVLRVERGRDHRLRPVHLHARDAANGNPQVADLVALRDHVVRIGDAESNRLGGETDGRADAVRDVQRDSGADDERDRNDDPRLERAPELERQAGAVDPFGAVVADLDHRFAADLIRGMFESGL